MRAHDKNEDEKKNMNIRIFLVLALSIGIFATGEVCAFGESDLGNADDPNQGVVQIFRGIHERTPDLMADSTNSHIRVVPQSLNDDQRLVYAEDETKIGNALPTQSAKVQPDHINANNSDHAEVNLYDLVVVKILRGIHEDTRDLNLESENTHNLLLPQSVNDDQELVYTEDITRVGDAKGNTELKQSSDKQPACSYSNHLEPMASAQPNSTVVRITRGNHQST